MLISMFFILLFLSIFLPPAANGYVKRQVSLDDIIQGALNFVRPIIDTSQPLQADLMTLKKLQSEPVGERDAEILGVPKYSALDNVPICKSNSKICKFISCSAHNFKNDESLTNLNLAAQILADTKLRKAIVSDPSTLLSICHEQGLSTSQCKLFSNAFQLIDRFISTIEPAGIIAKKLHHYIIKDDPYYDESDAPPVPIHPGTYQNVGSQTWSIRDNNISEIKPVLPDAQQPAQSDSGRLNSPTLNATALSTSMDANLTTNSAPTLFTFPPLIFTFPTLATFAPIISPPVMPPLTEMQMQLLPPMSFMPKELQNFLMPNFNNNLLLSKSMPMPTAKNAELGSETTMKTIRNKRSSDYYDDVEDENSETSKNTGIAQQNDDQKVSSAKLKTDRKGLFDCIKILQD